MLDKLPPEVILAISSLLIFQEKLILIKTCRHLFNVISKTDLYSELDLPDHKEKVEEIIGNFAEGRYSGSHVRQISFDISEFPEQLLLQLPTIFPNITQATSELGVRWMKDEASKCSTLNWSKTLEVYRARTDWAAILPALKTTTFPRLTCLELGFIYLFEDKSQGFDTSYFIPYIKNAPALKALGLSYCAIDLEFLEELHASCPYLEELTLNDVDIVIETNTLAQSITPADSLLCLDIIAPNCFDTKGLFLDYITTKYRCLIDVYLEFNNYEYGTLSFTRSYKRFSIESAGMSDSESDMYDIDPPLMPEHTTIYNSLQDDFQRTVDIYWQSGTSFFSKLTPSIKTINIEGDPFDNTIEALSNSDTKLIELIYERDVEYPDQIQNISNLKHLNKLRISVAFPEQTDFQVFPSVTVTILDFASYSYDIAFDWLLQSFPSLEDLCIKGSRWTISDKDNSTAAMFPSLCKLEARVESFDQDCIDFLVKNAINLKVLELETSRKKPATCDMNMDLSGMFFMKICVRFQEMNFQESFYFNIKTPYLDEVLRYNPTQRSVSLVKNKVYAIDDAKPSMLNITCDDNIQFLFFEGGISLDKKKIILLSTNKQ